MNIPQHMQGDIACLKGSKLSRSAWCQSVRQVMAQLPEEITAIHLAQNRVNLMTAIVAVSAIHGRNLLPPDNQASTVQWLRDQYPGAVVLGEGGEVDIAIDAQVAEGANRTTSLSLQLDPESEAVVAHTSGSTGTPKAVSKTWKSVHQTALSTIDQLIAPVATISPSRSAPIDLIATVPAQHMYGLETTVMIALMGQGIVHPDKPFFPADIATQLASTHNPAVLITTPIHLNACLRSGVTFPPVARIISATAPLDSDLAIAVEDRFNCELWEIYGCTEGGSLASRRTSVESNWRMLPRFTIRSQADKPTVLSPAFAAPVELPDRVEVLSKTKFVLLGRDEDLVNIGGKRGSLSGLETQLLNIPGIEDVHLFEHNERIKGLVVSNEKTSREILTEFARRVDPVFVPRPLKIVSVIPRNATGKISRKQAMALFDK